MPDINMFIINDYTDASRQMIAELSSRVSFPVYQDTPELALWSRVYGGDKDDFFIFDRCGQMTFHIRPPVSYLTYHHTQWALYTTYHDNPCYCHRDRRHRPEHRARSRRTRHLQDPHDQMQGDAPVRAHHGSRPRSQRCHGDLMCRIYHRLLRQNRLHGHGSSHTQRYRQH